MRRQSIRSYILFTLKLAINLMLSKKLRNLRRRNKINSFNFAKAINVKYIDLKKYEYGFKTVPGNIIYKYIQTGLMNDEDKFFLSTLNESLIDKYIEDNRVLRALKKVESLFRKKQVKEPALDQFHFHQKAHSETLQDPRIPHQQV